MVLPVLGAIAGIGAKLWSDRQNRKSVNSTNAANQRQWYEQMEATQGYNERDYERHSRWRAVEKDQDNRQMQHQFENQFGWLVEGAQKAGFNPLTVLGQGQTFSGGGGMSGPGSYPLGPQNEAPRYDANISPELVAIGEYMDPIERANRRLENELLEARIKQINNEETRLGQMPQVRRTSSPVETTQFPGTDPRNPEFQGPLTPPNNPAFPRINVWTPYGQLANIPEDIATRLNLQPGGIMMQEDMTALLGEFIGEGAGLLQPNEMVDLMTDMGFIEDFGDRTMRENEEEAERQEKQEFKENFEKKPHWRTPNKGN